MDRAWAAAHPTTTAAPRVAPPTTGGVAPPTPSIGIPGFDPDYAALLRSDPSLLQGEADIGLYQTQLDTGLRDAIRRAVIAAGLDPGTSVGAVDDATRAAAKQNQFSAAAELATQRSRRQTDLEAALAARGILSSGALTGGGQRVQQDYEKGTSTLLNDLLSRISGVESEGADKRFQLQQQRASLREQAASRIQGDPRYQPQGSARAVLDPDTGLYVTPDGRYYTASGQRVDPNTYIRPAAAPSPPQVQTAQPVPVQGYNPSQLTAAQIRHNILEA